MLINRAGSCVGSGVGTGVGAGLGVGLGDGIGVGEGEALGSAGVSTVGASDGVAGAETNIALPHPEK